METYRSGVVVRELEPLRVGRVGAGQADALLEAAHHRLRLLQLQQRRFLLLRS